MNLKWYVGCPQPDDKVERGQLYNSCQQILLVLRDIVEKDLEAAQTKQLSEATYDKAAWAYYQADKNGELRALKNILELLPERTKK